MNDFDDLLERIETPPADVHDDVARGERALRRRHRWQIGAASLAVVAASGAGVALTGAGGTSQAGFSARPSQTAGTHTKQQLARQQAKKEHAKEKHAKQEVKQPRSASRSAKEQARRLQHQVRADHEIGTLQTFHDVLAEHLDPTGQLLTFAKNEQSGSGSLGTKLDWNHGGMLEISVSTSWRTSDWNAYPPGPGQRLTYHGHPARVLVDGTDIWVAVQHDDGEVVMLLASRSFGNNGTSTASLDLTQDQLLAAAADQRLSLPPSMR
jgi:hypothetical protein